MSFRRVHSTGGNVGGGAGSGPGGSGRSFSDIHMRKLSFLGFGKVRVVIRTVKSSDKFVGFCTILRLNPIYLIIFQRKGFPSGVKPLNIRIHKSVHRLLSALSLRSV